jgi:solute carrier family 25 iron transporter 28/37
MTQPPPTPQEEEEELDLEWEEWDPARLSFAGHMLAGSFAGLAEHVCIFPMDTLKTNMQCDQCDGARGRAGPGPFQTVKCAQRIVQQSGMLRLWRGVSAMFAGCIPAHAAYFSIFESLKVALGADREGHYPLRAAVCGASATFVHDLMMTPFDVVKQRMQLGYHRSVLDCVR